MKGVRKQREKSKFILSDLRKLSSNELKGLELHWRKVSRKQGSKDAELKALRIAQRINKARDNKEYNTVLAYELRDNPTNKMKDYLYY